MKKTGKYDEDERDAHDEDDEVGDENEADDGDGGWMRVKMKVIIRWRSKPCFIGKHTPVHLSDMSAETPYKCETLTSLKVVRYRGNSTADYSEKKNDATAAIARTSVLLPRDRENDVATVAISGKYKFGAAEGMLLARSPSDSVGDIVGLQG